MRRMRIAFHLILLAVLVWLPISQAAAWCCPVESEQAEQAMLDMRADAAAMPCHGDTGAAQTPEPSWNDMHEGCQQHGCGHLGQLSVMAPQVQQLAFIQRDVSPNRHVLAARPAHIDLLLRPPILT